MDEKTFELLTQMYNELTSFRKETNTRFDKVESEIQKVGNQVAKIEQEHGTKLEALLDGYKQLAEGQEEIKDQLQDLQAKVSNSEVEITVIKGGKQVAR